MPGKRRTSMEMSTPKTSSIQVGCMFRDCEHSQLTQSERPQWKKIISKIPIYANASQIKVEAINKHSRHYQNFCALENYVLLYPDGREVMFVPGVENQTFKLCLYKEELNKQYFQIVFLR